MPTQAEHESDIRADQLLVQQGLAHSRTEAQRLIERGCVYRELDKLRETVQGNAAQGITEQRITEQGNKIVRAAQRLPHNTRLYVDAEESF